MRRISSQLINPTKTSQKMTEDAQASASPSKPKIPKPDNPQIPAIEESSSSGAEEVDGIRVAKPVTIAGQEAKREEDKKFGGNWKRDDEEKKDEKPKVNFAPKLEVKEIESETKEKPEGLDNFLKDKGYEVVDSFGDDPEEYPDPEDFKHMSATSRIPNLQPNDAKEKGNKHFKNKKYKKAILYYQAGMKAVLSALCKGPEALNDENLSEIDLTLNLNTAQCYINLGDYEMALDHCKKALMRRHQFKNEALVAKALYRKACCLSHMPTKVEETVEVLKDLLENVDPDNKAAKQMFNEMNAKKLKQQKQNESGMKKMFKNYSKAVGENAEKAKAERVKLCDEVLGFNNGCVFEFENDSGDESEEKSKVKKNNPTCDVVKNALRKIVVDMDYSDDFAAAIPKDSSIALVEERLRPFDRSQWGRQFVANVVVTIAEFARRWKIQVEAEKGVKEEDVVNPLWDLTDKTSLATVEDEVTIWFVGASSTFELNFIDLQDFLDIFPQEIKLIKLVCIGFNGELSPDGKITIMDKGAANLKDGVYKELSEEKLVAGSVDSGAKVTKTRKAVIETYTGMLETVVQERPELIKGAAKPKFAFLFQPLLHRYLREWFDGVQVLINEKIPWSVIGGSKPDPSFAQDEKIGESLGAKCVFAPIISPNPMTLGGSKLEGVAKAGDSDKKRKELAEAMASKVSKCNHFCAFYGGSGKTKNMLTKIKLDLLMNDYNISGK